MTTTVQILRTGLASALVALAGLASAAQASDLIGDEQATSLDMAEVMIDAARSFELVDVNVDGVIDIDEYSSQRVVRAQLARFSRSIRVDGQTVLNVAVPEGVSKRLTQSERAALDTVSRNEFHLRSAGSEGLTPAQWQDSRLEAFTLADMDASGALEGAELEGYARFLAGSLSLVQLGS